MSWNISEVERFAALLALDRKTLHSYFPILDEENVDSNIEDRRKVVVDFFGELDEGASDFQKSLSATVHQGDVHEVFKLFLDVPRPEERDAGN